MVKPRTYRPDQPATNITIRHYEVMLVEHALIRSAVAYELKEYAAIFGHILQDYAPERTPRKRKLDNKVALTIDACLAGERPDLDAAIWKAVIDILEDESLNQYWHNIYNPIIYPLDIEFLKHMGIALPAVILTCLLLKIGTSDEYLSIYNKDRTTRAEFTAITVENSKKKAEHSVFTIRNIKLSEDVTWYDYGLHVKNMPETIANCLEGRKLREFITHPVLDKFDLTILQIIARDDEIFIITDHHIIPNNSVRIIEMAEQS